MNLPHALTVLRIFLVPVLVVVLLTRSRTDVGVTLGMAIFGVAVLTDYLDGYFARRRNQVTKLGILLDPTADKLLTAAACLSLVEMDAVPAWMVMIILGRELAVTGLRNIAARKGIIPASNRQGQDGDQVGGVPAALSRSFDPGDPGPPAGGGGAGVGVRLLQRFWRTGIGARRVAGRVAEERVPGWPERPAGFSSAARPRRR